MTSRAHHPTEDSLLDRMAERLTPELVSQSPSDDDAQVAVLGASAADEPDVVDPELQSRAASAEAVFDADIAEAKAIQAAASAATLPGRSSSERLPEDRFPDGTLSQGPLAGAAEDARFSGAAGLPASTASDADASEMELGFGDLESETPDSAPDSLEADAIEVGLITGEPSTDARAAQRPWVDDVPDPVTPFEQRVSETIKLADLPPVELLRGRVVANRYLAEELAEKTPACVSYRAYHLALDRAVTVRVLPRGLACSDDLCQEVRRVARLATELGDVHVAATLDFGVTNDGWPFVVTEHFAGRSLAALLAEEGKFVLRRVLHIGKQMAEGLSVAHQAGITHGLLSPDNVMVIDPGTSAEVATILGFGVVAARGLSPGPPRSGVFGVPFYVAPEQASCRALDPRSDLYAMGVILYQLMTGNAPFADGDFAAVLCQHLDDEAQPPSARLRAPGALAKAMDAIIERCLRKEPDQRYQTAAELGEDLTRLEAAAARNKRRPMPEIQRPTSTIHAPAPRVDSLPPGAKVIVNGAADEPPVQPPSSERKAATPSPPAVRPALAAARAARAAEAARVATTPAVRRAPRIATDQATIRISAVDREAALAHYRNASVRQSWGMAFQGFGAALGTSFTLLVRWLIARVRSVLGGAQGFVAEAHRREVPASPASASERRSERPSQPASSFAARPSTPSPPPSGPAPVPSATSASPSSDSVSPSLVAEKSPTPESPAVASTLVESPVAGNPAPTSQAHAPTEK